MNYTHELVQDDIELQLRFAVIDAHSEYFPTHWHNHLEILYIIDGSMSAYVNDHRYELRSRDILIINSKEIHSTLFSGSIRYLLLQVPLNDLRRLIPDFETLQFEDYYPHEAIDINPASKMEVLLLEMKREFEKKGGGYQLLFTSFFYEFLYELYTNHSIKLSAQSMNKAAKNLLRIERVMNYVKTHYKEPITLDEIADIVSLRPEYFCRMFKKNTNQTFLEYVNTVRLVHFYNDLIHSNDSITYLLDLNGITNYKVFIRMFKKVYGQTPGKTRKTRS